MNDLLYFPCSVTDPLLTSKASISNGAFHNANSPALRKHADNSDLIQLPFQNSRTWNETYRAWTVLTTMFLWHRKSRSLLRDLPELRCLSLLHASHWPPLASQGTSLTFCCSPARHSKLLIPAPQGDLDSKMYPKLFSLETQIWGRKSGHNIFHLQLNFCFSPSTFILSFHSSYEQGLMSIVREQGCSKDDTKLAWYTFYYHNLCLRWKMVLMHRADTSTTSTQFLSEWETATNRRQKDWVLGLPGKQTDAQMMGKLSGGSAAQGLMDTLR